MLTPDMESRDEVLEYAARLIEEASFLDLRGIMSKRKRDREDADLRFRTIQETRAECARRIRAFKSRADLDATAVLARIAATPEGQRQVMALRDAWPLAWKGWLNIDAVMRCNSNSIPPQVQYRITLTERGQGILDAARAIDARSDETAQRARPEGRERDGEAGSPNHHSATDGDAA